MLWMTVLLLISTVLSAMVTPKFSIGELLPVPDRRVPSLEKVLFKDYDYFYRNTRDSEAEDPPKHEKPRPLRFG